MPNGVITHTRAYELYIDSETKFLSLEALETVAANVWGDSNFRLKQWTNNVKLHPYIAHEPYHYHVEIGSIRGII